MIVTKLLEDKILVLYGGLHQNPNTTYALWVSSKISQTIQRQASGLRTPLTAPLVFAGRKLRGDSKKVLPPFLIISERAGSYGDLSIVVHNAIFQYRDMCL